MSWLDLVLGVINKPIKEESHLGADLSLVDDAKTTTSKTYTGVNQSVREAQALHKFVENQPQPSPSIRRKRGEKQRKKRSQIWVKIHACISSIMASSCSLSTCSRVR